MFEKSKPVPRAFSGDGFSDELLIGPWVGTIDSPPEEGDDGVRTGEALRAIEWSELTARLNAARELRRELREDSILIAGSSGARFGDAAASFFKALGNGERPVNPNGLEACKASCGNTSEQAEIAAIGDARDEL
ncbi:MAG: hypothetical protein WBA51_07510 [Erythrobacter sp.]